MTTEKAQRTSCGVLVGTLDGRILLGKTAGSRRWDLPKGLAEPGEEWSHAAARELEEETGLIAPVAELNPIGRFDYLPGKDLVLFSWRPPSIVDPADLRCRSTFKARNGLLLPELERFAFFAWERALIRWERTWPGCYRNSASGHRA